MEKCLWFSAKRVEEWFQKERVRYCNLYQVEWHGLALSHPDERIIVRVPRFILFEREKYFNTVFLHCGLFLFL